MGEGGALLVAGVLLGTVSGLVPRAASAAFVPGHLYSTGEDYPPAISEFDASGRPLDTLILPDGIGGAPRGLTFGPDGLLYVILAADNGFAVVALDHCGVVQATYRGDDYLQGDSLSGRLVVAADAIYVAARAHVVRFDRSQPGRGSIIYENDGVRDVVDVVQLPSGNLLVASEQDIDEITLLGVELPREDPVWISAGYIRGLAYDPIGDDIYVSQWGFSDVGHRVLRVDAASGAVKGAVAITYPSDLLWTSTGTLLLTLRFGPALRYSAQLMPIGLLGGDATQSFIAEHPISPQCGDRELDPLERCDDGNRIAGDGCDANCASEPRYVGVRPTALHIAEDPSAGVGSIRFTARDRSVVTGAAGGLDDIESTITIDYGNGAGSGLFRLPACDPGWRANDGGRATFVTAAAAQSGRTSIVESGRRLDFSAASLGDRPLSILGFANPRHGVLIAHCTINRGAETCLCSEFASCRRKTVGERAMLACRDGRPDPACRAIGR